MAKNTPSFQFYPSDFLGGVMLLSDEAVGIYIKLLSALWIHGNALPEQEEKLVRSANTTSDALRRCWPELKDKFDVENGVVSHPRFSHMLEVAEARSENGKKGGRGNKSKTKAKQKLNKSKSKANALKYEDRRLKFEDQSLKGEGWDIPERLDSPEVREALDDFAEMRRTIKKPIKSLQNSSRMLKNFEDAEHLLYAIELCIANEWQGLKPDYMPPKRQAKPAQGDKAARMLKELEE